MDRTAASPITHNVADSTGQGLHRFKPYPEYKDSAVEWLGYIPEHWEMAKIKYSTYVKGRIGWQGLRADEFTDEGPFCVTGTDFQDGKINWGLCYRVSQERYLLDPYIHLREGDLLITKDGTIGKTAIVSQLEGEATLNSGIFLTRPLGSTYLSEFLYWVLNSLVFKEFFSYEGLGSTIIHLYQETFEEFVFPKPRISEQQAIVAFLDRETAKIDALISKRERLIELLQEKRTALISQAVTKGINPNVPMKDSGIEWLGEIPIHWEVFPLKRIAKRIQTGSTPPTSETHYYENGTVPWFGPASFSDELVLSEPMKFISEEAVSDGVARLFDANSIMIVTIGATIGKVGYIQRPGSSNQQITAITSDESRLTGKFGAYQLKRIEPVLQGVAPSTTLPIIDQVEIGYLPVAFPRTDEQVSIVEYINQESQSIGKLLDKVQDGIQLLKEYRQALISAAVTGKIDVRGEAG